ncbi:MAG: DUF3145 family protein [Actinomycetota bacterium]
MKTLPSVGFGPTHGYLYIHAAPRAVLKNLEWGIAEVLQMPISLKWEPQPLLSGSYRSEVSWNGLQGTASRLVSTVKGWHYITFELFESSSQGSDGSLYMFAPELGLFRGTVSPTGDLVINENQIQKILNENLNPGLALEEIENLLGKKWDEVLDPYRHMAMGGEDVDARLSV